MRIVEGVDVGGRSTVSFLVRDESDTGSSLNERFRIVALVAEVRESHTDDSAHDELGDSAKTTMGHAHLDGRVVQKLYLR